MADEIVCFLEISVPDTNLMSLEIFDNDNPSAIEIVELANQFEVDILHPDTMTLEFVTGGVKGDPGEQGDPGPSAYQSWLNAGHSGTESDFVSWLRLNGIATYVQDETPTDTGKYIWLQTNFEAPGDFTLWFNDGA